MRSSADRELGLGLSIVAGIIKRLNGDISIDSRPGEGSEALVVLPLSPTKSISEEAKTEDKIQVARRSCNGCTVAFFGFDDDLKSDLLATSVKSYMVDWLAMTVLSGADDRPLDFGIFSGASCQDNVLEVSETARRCSSIVMLGASHTQLQRFQPNLPRDRVIEWLIMPFGPYKLANCFLECQNRMQASLAMNDTKLEPMTSPSLRLAARSLPSDSSNLASPNLTVETNTRQPRVLCVDDNEINLRLLQTFMKRKRKYDFVQGAEDGAVAVNAVKNCPEGFDFIFMGKWSLLSRMSWQC